MKHLAILGSTGSIGESALRVVRHLSGLLQVTTLAARSNIDRLYEQALEFRPQLVAVADEEKAEELRRRLPQCKVMGGMQAVQEAACHDDVDMVLAAITGTAGIGSTLAAIDAGKDIALANKEVLVSAGALAMSKARERGVQIIPVDSEHSAIFQCLNGEKRSAIRRIILTSSGGPFRLWSSEQLEMVTLACAMRHPNFSMGPKVTIDSSTLMNKGLEVLEAHWLFDVPWEKIEVVIQPQQIIHSMVEFVDGSIMAQMGVPEMLVPIQYALTYPNRREGLHAPFDFAKNNKLEFFAPDNDKFRCLPLAYQAGAIGGTLPSYMNAANEVLVERFIKGEIEWKAIGAKLANLMSRHTVQPGGSLESILAVDQLARQEASHA